MSEPLLNAMRVVNVLAVCELRILVVVENVVAANRAFSSMSQLAR